MASPFMASFVPSPEIVRAVREKVAAIAIDCGLDEPAIHDIRLAVSEAATNALVHGCGHSAHDCRIHVRAELVDDELRVDLCDDGSGMRPRTDSPGLGLGLPLMAQLTKSLDISDAGPGTRIRLAFACPTTG